MAPLPRLLLPALALGFAAGTMETALRAAPRLGLDATDTLTWLALSVGLATGWSLALAAALHVGTRLLPRLPALGLLVGLTAGLHAILWYRFEVVLNEFLYRPVVWGPALALGLGSLGLGWLLQRPLLALGRLFTAGCLVLAGLGALASFRGSLPPPAPAAALPADAPNLLLVTLDTVRRDALAPWSGTGATPTAARLAREGVAFDDAVATAPLTEPSHLAILTGRSPYRTGFVSNGTDLGPQPALISHALQAAGYATGAFVSGFPLHGKYGWTQGFDVYDDDFGRLPGLHRLTLVKAWDQVALPAHALRERTGDLALARAGTWLDRVQDRPWFCWVHFFDPHAPYEAPPPFGPDSPPPTDGAPLALPAFWPPRHKAVTEVAWLERAYLGEVAWTDHLLGRLLDRLTATGALDRTAVVVLADHGESLTEHGYLFDHGDNLYDPSLRVPLTVRYPPLAAPGTRVPCQVGTQDIAPTLLHLAGIQDDQERDGRSLVPLMGGASCEDADVVAATVAGRFVASPPVDKALRARDRKLIRHGDVEGDARPDELYDLTEDPGETRNLASTRTPEAAALGLVLDGLLSGTGPAQSPSLDADTQNALKALGYME